MKAAQICSPGILEVKDVTDPVRPSGGVLLKILACAVCGTDVKMLEQGHCALTYPRIPGHEITAQILEMDDPRSPLEVGDKVQVWPGEACGKCHHCLAGRDHLCPDIGIVGFNTDGGMAEMMTVKDASRLTPIGDADPCLLTLAEPLSCCINAQDKLHVSQGDAVLIMGGGPMGCMNALLAKRRGAKKVLVTEALTDRLGQAPTGLFDSIAMPSDVRIMVEQETAGEGVDVIIPCTPEVRLDEGTFSLLARGGRLCAFSGPRKVDSPLPVDVRDIHYRELTLVGSYGNSSHHDRLAVEMLRRGDIDAGWLITGKFSLDQARQAFEHASSRKGMKAVITI
jgi:L-iditol 2-dehydrogenase